MGKIWGPAAIVAVVSVVGALLTGACSKDGPDSGRQHDDDAGPEVDSGSPSDAGAAVSCEPALKYLVGPKGVPGGDYAWTGSRVVAVSGLQGGAGYVISDLDPTGDRETRTKTLWPDHGSDSSFVQAATSNGVVAVVDRRTDAVAGSVECRLALARLDPIESIQPPTGVDDPDVGGPEIDGIQLWSISGGSCDVAPLGDGFLLVWQQRAASDEGSLSMFAQRVGADGTAHGDRMMLAERYDAFASHSAIAADGKRVTIAVSSEREDLSPFLAFIGEDSFEKTPLDLGASKAPVIEQLRAAHDGFVALSSESVWLLDAEGRRTLGPRPRPRDALVGAFGDGYVVVENAEYLIATTRDAQLREPSHALGLSEDRGAQLVALLGNSSGGNAVVAVYDPGQNGYRFATLSCSDEPPPALGAPQCPMREVVTPLDDGCTDPVCHAVLRLDYTTLGVRGWAAMGGPNQPVNADEVKTIARDLFAANAPFVRVAPKIEEASSGIYLAYSEPGEWGAFALIGAQSGAVVSGGDVMWFGRGKHWAPAEWKPASDIECGESAAMPASTSGGTEDVLELARSTNLAAGFAARGPFDVYVYPYWKAVSATARNPNTTEYLVVFSQTRP